MPEQDSTGAEITHEHTNRLVNETSPYLLQHAHNPVDWYPWSDEAIEAARSEDRPIFLSIGYSTCYWCHVMERECFENESIAELMNKDFVNIKVDREQRPDLDEIYMTSCQIFSQMTTGRASGGWPMSVFIDPRTLAPFYVGTYFPPEPGFGRPSFPQLLEGIATAWKQNRQSITEQAQRMSRLVTDQLGQQPPARPLGQDVVDQAINGLMGIHDTTHGGFGSAPKFPQPVLIEFLMATAGDRPAISKAIRHTLDRMATGGMYDQVGGGFHRYSVDEKWLVPHFEKMLYDNGQLASVYARSYLRDGDDYHARIVSETLEYVLREMTDAETGAFYSAQDAEVNHHEGENYLWTITEVTTVLQEAGLEEDIPLALEALGLDLGTNFQDPHHRELPPSNVLFMPMRPDELARDHGLTVEQVDEFLARIIPVLYEARLKRDQPGLDDKIITSWNGLMIKGMADGGRALGRREYVDAAISASRFIMEHMWDGSRLLRISRNGTYAIDGFLEDYAFMARGLLSLYEATDDPAYLDQAIQLVETARVMFWDEVSGGWFDTRADQADLFVRGRSVTDGALPSSTGVMLLNMLDLYRLTAEETYAEDFARAMSQASGQVAANPVGSCLSTLAIHSAIDLGLQQRLPTDMGEEPGLVDVAIEPASVQPAEQIEAMLVIRIPEGYHINAHEPGLGQLIGLQVDLESIEGVALEVSYPDGELYRDQVRIHSGTLRIPISIQIKGEAPASITLNVLTQSCTDVACMRPARTQVRLELGENS